LLPATLLHVDREPSHAVSVCVGTKYTPISLLDKNHYLIPLIGGSVHLETAVGVNGRVWISSDTPHNTILASRCVQSLDEGDMGEAAMRSFINDILSSR
jgi:exosome complex RNA-binding protein Rrp4